MIRRRTVRIPESLFIAARDALGLDETADASAVVRGAMATTAGVTAPTLRPGRKPGSVTLRGKVA